MSKLTRKEEIKLRRILWSERRAIDPSDSEEIYEWNPITGKNEFTTKGEAKRTANKKKIQWNYETQKNELMDE